MSNETRGLYYALILMMAAPFTLLGATSWLIWKALKKGKTSDPDALQTAPETR